MQLPEKIEDSFQTHFNRKPSYLVHAPGRVNLIGEHTDYNEGFVLPMAIDRAVWIAVGPRLDRQVQVLSLDYGDETSFNLDDLHRGQGWPEYLKGVAHLLQRQGFDLHGWEGVIAGNIPKGAGLSSSAAIEMAAARAFAVVSNFDWDILRVARMGQRVENEWIGVNSGIMDQMASAAAHEGNALFLDCRSLEYRHVPLPDGLSVVVLDTSTRRGLIDSAYNERRAQCEAAARFFGVPALRDVAPDEFERRGRELTDVVRRRARHVITENQRVLDSVAGMERGDSGSLGKLLNQSHVSLRDDFEVSSAALDQMVECAWEQPGCFGARMTGGGFAGCAVALVEARQVDLFAAQVGDRFHQKSRLEPKVYVCRASGGADVLRLET